MNRHLASAVIALGLGALPAHAAHVYAAANGAIQIYDVAGNGSLSLRQTLASGTVTAMAITPGGRFLYATDGQTITEYSAQPDGSLVQFGGPVALNYPPGVNALAMHPSGDFLYALSNQVLLFAFRTDDADGHLTPLSVGQTLPGDGNVAVTVTPDGAFLLTATTWEGAENSTVRSFRTRADGSLDSPRLQDLSGPAKALAADGKYVYAAVAGTLAVLAVQSDGGLKVVSSQTAPGASLQVVGPYLAASAGGKGSSLTIYSSDAVNPCGGSLRQTGAAPIEVFAMAAARTGSLLWVATDDGIVTYTVNADGSLGRVAKAFVNGVTDMAYGIR